MKTIQKIGAVGVLGLATLLSGCADPAFPIERESCPKDGNWFLAETYQKPKDDSSQLNPVFLYAWDIDGDKIVDEAIQVNGLSRGLGLSLWDLPLQLGNIPKSNWIHLKAEDVKKPFYQTDNTRAMTLEERAAYTLMLKQLQ